MQKQHTIIYLNGTIAEKNISNIITQLNSAYNNDEKVIIQINSEGGDVVQSLALVDCMNYYQDHGMKIITLVCGLACSAAVNVLVAGSERYATKNSLFLIHHPSYDLASNYDYINKTHVDFWTKILQRYIDDVIIKIKPKYRKEVLTKLKSEFYFDTSKAIEIGLINKLWK